MSIERTDKPGGASITVTFSPPPQQLLDACKAIADRKDGDAAVTYAQIRDLARLTLALAEQHALMVELFRQMADVGPIRATGPNRR